MKRTSMRSMVAMSAIFSCRAMSAADRVIVVPVPASLRDWITFAGTLITLAALVVAIVTLRWSVKQWRWTYFTKEWSTLMHFLKDDARFMDAENAANYKTAFAGEDRMKYDVIARLCIGYLDDLYFLGSEKEMCTWFRGTMRLFAVTHRAWLEDNRDAYDPRFYRFISSWTKSEQ